MSVGNIANFLKGCFLFIAMSSAGSQVFAVQGDANKAAIALPSALEPWLSWVTEGIYQRDAEFGCVRNHLVNLKSCALPSELSLIIDEPHGEFEQRWLLKRESWVQLPGDEGAWPRLSNGVVINKNGLPYTLLSKGEHRLKGRLNWSNAVPRQLSVPANTGLLSLIRNDLKAGSTLGQKQTLGGSDVVLSNGKIELGASLTKPKIEVLPEDTLNIEVYRLLKDGQVFTIDTQIQLRVAGQVREALIGPVLFNDFELLSLNSPLLAQQEGDYLRVELKPGEWMLSLSSRYLQQLNSLHLPQVKKDKAASGNAGKKGYANSTVAWPEQELWAFQADPNTRLVDLQGLTPIDPSQTSMPSYWHGFPSFAPFTGQTLTLVPRQRGAISPDNKLALRRDIRIDFDGGGYTLTDLLTGDLTRDWRISTIPELELGSATDTAENQPLLITKLVDGARGIELRSPKVSVAADSRINSAASQIPANGWQQTLESADITVFIPPGWTLLGVSGADVVDNTWFSRWTLLDLFIVLLTVIAAWQVWGPAVSAVLAGLLIMTWHNADAPQWLWLNLVAAWALWQALPESRIRLMLSHYRNLVLLVIVLVSVPFAVDQCRRALYDGYDSYGQQGQREIGLYNSVSQSYRRQEHYAVSDMAMAPMAERVESSASIAEGNAHRRLTKMTMSAMDEGSGMASAAPRKVVVNTLDGGTVQTGPGVPSWEYQRATVHIAGPIAVDSTIRLFLLKPWMMNVIHMLTVVLLLTIIGFLLRRLPLSFKVLSAKGQRAASAFVVLLVFGAPFFSSNQVNAGDIPSVELLNQLEQRIRQQERGDCENDCISFAGQAIQLNQTTLNISIEVHASEPRIVALPSDDNQWLPNQVLLNSKPALGLQRLNGQLWLAVDEGKHVVELVGAAPSQSFNLPIPTPTAITTVKVEGWKVSGLRGAKAQGQLQFEKIQASNIAENTLAVGKRLAPPFNGDTKTVKSKTEISPFFRLTRELVFDQSWRIDNTLLRLSAESSSVSLQIDLLPGESVISKQTVSDGKVRINVGSGERVQRWHSVLKQQPSIHFIAPSSVDNKPWHEVWRIKVSGLWNAEQVSNNQIARLPVNSSIVQNGYWQAEWRPWPSEQLALRLQKPAAASGASLTIQQSELSVRPGKRSREMQLVLLLRSSIGAQHPIALPKGSKLMEVVIDGKRIPLELESTETSENLILPIEPGPQRIEIRFSTEQTLGTTLRTPAINLGAESVNSHITVEQPLSRWVLATGGPSLGPVVLIWGMLIVLVIAALVLAKIPAVPLTFIAWILLFVGLSQVHIVACAVVVGWFLALTYYKPFTQERSPVVFNACQLLMGFWTVAAAVVLVAAIEKGLLGLPSMQIQGNGSSANNLLWYQDRAGAELPQAWVFSLPLLVYRVLMLLWSLWMAFSVVRWVKWAWQQFSQEGLWKKGAAKKTPLDSSVESDQQSDSKGL